MNTLFDSMVKAPPIKLAEVSEEVQALRDAPARVLFDAELTFKGVLDDAVFAEIEDAQTRRVVAAETASWRWIWG